MALPSTMGVAARHLDRLHWKCATAVMEEDGFNQAPLCSFITSKEMEEHQALARQNSVQESTRSSMIHGHVMGDWSGRYGAFCRTCLVIVAIHTSGNKRSLGSDDITATEEKCAQNVILRVGMDQMLMTSFSGCCCGQVRYCQNTINSTHSPQTWTTFS